MLMLWLSRSEVVIVMLMLWLSGSEGVCEGDPGAQPGDVRRPGAEPRARAQHEGTSADGRAATRSSQQHRAHNATVFRRVSEGAS